MLYLDCNATTPCAPEVVEAMLPFFSGTFGNPSSRHLPGQEAAAVVMRAAGQVAALIHAEPEQILFTACATESNNSAVFNAPAGTILISSAEHSSLYEPVRKRGDFRIVEPSPEAILAADAITSVALNLANHETGELLPEPETIAAGCRSRNIRIHFDATQAAGKLPIDVRKLDCDTLAFSAHKIYGPKGVGALYVRDPSRFKPLLEGGGQQRGLRAGTLDVPGIVGFGKAAELAAGHFPSPAPRDRFEARLAESGLRFVIAGAGRLRLAQTSCVLFPGQDAEKLVLELSAKGVAVSSGSACSSGGISRILLAQGFDRLSAAGALRISFGRDSTPEEAVHAAEILIATIRNHQHPGVIDV